MKKKIAGTFILVCGLIVLGLEIVLTVVAFVNGRALSEGIMSILTTLLIGIFLIVFGLQLRKEGQ